MDACGGDAGSDGGARAPFEATFALVLSMTSRSSSLATGAPVPRAPVDMVRALDADERAFVFAASSLVAGGIARRGVTRLGRRAERLKPRRAWERAVMKSVHRDVYVYVHVLAILPRRRRVV
tara:strand:+ start:2794 stop:3159 length:366 start_codon:yes stop_codon:yes gene_type:complete